MLKLRWMMERIHENLVVATSQCDGALQLAVLNSGFDVATLRADLSSSSNVDLRVAHAPIDTSSSALQFECQVYPLERKTLARILKAPGKRAFVRVHYDLTDVREPAVDEIQQAQHDRERDIQEATRRAHEVFSASSSGMHLLHMSSAPRYLIRRCCADVNRFFAMHSDNGIRFVDTSFPPTLASLIGIESSESVPASADGDQDKGGDGVTNAALFSLTSWMHLHDVADASWMFATTDKAPKQRSNQLDRSSSAPALRLPRLTQFRSALPGQDSLLGALAYLSLDKHTWLKRLITTAELLQSHNGADVAQGMRELTAISVQLCEYGVQWRQIVVDLFVPVFPVGCGLMAVCASVSGEMYPTILQKALAKLKGSYKAIGMMPTVTILRELTGVPWMNIYRAGEKRTDQVRYATVTTREALQRLISRRHTRRHRESKQKERGGERQVFVASFGLVGDHHVAFPVLTGDEDHGIVLQDVNGAIANALGRPAQVNTRSSSLGVLDDDDEDLVVGCSWQEFFQLKPNVWMVLANHRESMRKRLKFIDQSSSSDSPPPLQATQFQFAFSLVEMTSVVIVTQLDGRQRSDSQQYTLTLDAVESDFTLARIAGESASECSDDTYSELRLVVALGAGEYVLSVEIEPKSELRPCNTTPDESATRSSSGVFTATDPERNLQLLFDCIDQDMDGVISLSELQAFLEKHESSSDVLQVAGDPSVLSTFMQRFGSPDCTCDSIDSLTDLTSSSRDQLLVGDLSAVYRFLASTQQETVSASSKQGVALQTKQQCYEEIIWDDLIALLVPHGAAAVSSFRQHDITELRYCIHADAPLVSFAQLPPDAIVQ